MEMEEWASSLGTNGSFFVFATQYPKHEHKDHCPRRQNGRRDKLFTLLDLLHNSCTDHKGWDIGSGCK